MKNFAPEITRQRLLIEGFYNREVDPEIIKKYFSEVIDRLNLKMYSEPIIYSPAGAGREENQGYDAFVPLIDSGISLYVWTNKKFLSGIIYTCKFFNASVACDTTKQFFKMKDIDWMVF
jgi:hypothetical protein